MKSCIIHLRGLWDTDEAGSWCGAKQHVQALAAKYDLKIIPGNWNDAGINHVVDLARQAGFQFVALGGHSHGSWEVGEIQKRYGAEAIDFVYRVDNCPFLDPGAQFGDPIEFPASATFGYACWQHNSEPAGVKYLPSKRVVAVDATAWRGPKLGHIDFPNLGLSSIAGDSRVWYGADSIEQQLKAAINARTFPPAV